MKLIVSPHVDDEVLGCGGILDDRTHVLHMGLAEAQNHGHKVISKEQRLEEFAKVIQLSGLHGHTLLDHPVNCYQEHKLISDIERVVNEMQPEVVYIPHPSYNQDHRAVFDASLIALRPHDVNYFVPKVLVYEQPHVFLWDPNPKFFKPTFFKEIDVNYKIKLYKALESQVRNYRSPDTIEALARLRGQQCRVPYAEAFEVLRYCEH